MRSFKHKRLFLSVQDGAAIVALLLLALGGMGYLLGFELVPVMQLLLLSVLVAPAILHWLIFSRIGEVRFWDS